jgi:hypothetical protein
MWRNVVDGVNLRTHGTHIGMLRVEYSILGPMLRCGIVRLQTEFNGLGSHSFAINPNFLRLLGSGFGTQKRRSANPVRMLTIYPDEWHRHGSAAACPALWRLENGRPLKPERFFATDAAKQTGPSFGR